MATLDVHSAIPQEHRPEQVAQAILNAAVSLIGAGYGEMRLGMSPDAPIRAYAAGLSGDEMERIGSWQTSDVLSADLFGDEGLLLIPDTRVHPAFRDAVRELPGMLSVIGVSLRSHGEIWGHLYLADKLDGSRFDGVDGRVLMLFAMTQVQAIEHVDALVRESAVETMLEASVALSHRLLVAADTQEIWEELATAGQEVADCEMISVITSVPDTDQVVLRVSRGLGSEMQGFTFSAANTDLGYVLESGRSLRMVDVHAPRPTDDLKAISALDPDHTLGPNVLVPLSGGAGVIGVLAATRGTCKPPFDELTVTTLESLGVRAGATVGYHLARAAATEADLRRVAEVEEANQLLAAALGRESKAGQAKTDFLSRMSHELRTPMNSVLGFTQLLEMEDLTEEQSECLHSISRNGRYLLELINDLLDVGRIESGNLKMSLEPVGVAKCVDSALGMVASVAAKRHIVLKFSPIPGEEIFARADLRRLTQVLLNLLSNAVKFTREEGHVWVEARVRERGVEITVRDDGPGILAKDLDGLFEPFARAASAEGVEGSGLGLALVAGLTKAMGGSIEVESQVGVGSAFTVVLEPDAPLSTGRMGGHVLSAADVLPDSTVARRTVGYVEDNQANLELMVKVLRRRPELRLVSAMTVAEGLELIRKQALDLVLLDLHLPDGDGLDVLRAVKRNPATCQVPVVVISADATPSERSRLLEAGAVDYLVKPLDLRELLGIIDRFTI